MGQSVRPINQQILGMDGTDNLIPQIIPAIGIIDTGTFRPGVAANTLNFNFAPQTSGRLCIFAAEKDGIERAVIMLLPQSARPDGVVIGITQGFAQAASNLEPLGWSNPLSPPFVQFALLKHVINRWGAQTLASGRNLAFMYILRAKGNELGPFARDGHFLRFVLEEIQSQTADSFGFDQCEAFTFSSGIHEFNAWVPRAADNINITSVYSVDPAHSTPMTVPPGARRKQYASGTAGGLNPGFEPMPLPRWSNEDAFATSGQIGRFQYLHNRCMPLYVLNLALRTP